MARVFQPQYLFRQQEQGQLQGHAVEADSVVYLQQGLVAMQDIVDGVDGDTTLLHRIYRDAVVIDDGETRYQKQGACAQRQAMESGPFSNGIYHCRHAAILPF